MERMCFKFSIRAGTEEIYDKSHTDIWPELAEAILDSGYRNYSLFRRGTEIICSCECVPSIAEAQKKMKEKYSSLVDRWNVEMDKLIIEMHDETGSLFTYDLIWHLDVDESQSQ